MVNKVFSFFNTHVVLSKTKRRFIIQNLILQNKLLKHTKVLWLSIMFTLSVSKTNKIRLFNPWVSYMYVSFENVSVLTTIHKVRCNLAVLTLLLLQNNRYFRCNSIVSLSWAGGEETGHFSVCYWLALQWSCQFFSWSEATGICDKNEGWLINSEPQIEGME